MSKAEFLGEIKIKSTAEIVKDCKAEGKSKGDAWKEAYDGVNMPWFVKDTLEEEFNRLWGEIKIKTTAEIVKDCKAAGKSLEEAWNEAYGGVNMPPYVQDTLESEFNRLWEM